MNLIKQLGFEAKHENEKSQVWCDNKNINLTASMNFMLWVTYWKAGYDVALWTELKRKEKQTTCLHMDMNILVLRKIWLEIEIIFTNMYKGDSILSKKILLDIL